MVKKPRLPCSLEPATRPPHHHHRHLTPTTTPFGPALLHPLRYSRIPSYSHAESHLFLHSHLLPCTAITSPCIINTALALPYVSEYLSSPPVLSITFPSITHALFVSKRPCTRDGHEISVMRCRPASHEQRHPPPPAVVLSLLQLCSPIRVAIALAPSLFTDTCGHEFPLEILHSYLSRCSWQL